MGNSIRKIELLAPAKDLECGVAAINHGADAVYIGASKFGARKLAGNNLPDIERLIKHAHLFRAKVYVAINTLLFDNDLNDVQKLIWDLYNIGADAIIIQDMGILQMNLPPVALHASTQTDNRTKEKVKFFEDAGFEQIVLARELSLKQIKEIRRDTKISLEHFVHGALCVSYSGKCYMSHAATERSANRGECSQPCRLPYTLETASGKTIVKDKFLLSLKDLNLSDKLEDLIDAGVTSFKIEGRLKDAGYVKNITAHYREKLDAIINRENSNLKRSSSGKSFAGFSPAPEKSFSRGFSSYFIEGRQRDICSINTPKSLGEEIGIVLKTGKDFFVLQNQADLHNGDGLCFFDKNMQLSGTKVNYIEKDKIFVSTVENLKQGTIIYRNFSQQFNNILQSNAGERKIGIHICFSETGDGVKCCFTDENGISSETTVSIKKELADNPGKSFEHIKTQLLKLGASPFYSLSIKIDFRQPLFLTSSVVNNIRREAVENHTKKRIDLHLKPDIKLNPTYHPFPEKFTNFESNVLNQLAVSFYKQHEVENIPFGFEISEHAKKQRVMTTKHCIRYTLNLCPKQKKGENNDDLILKSNNQKYLLKFDCRECEMNVFTI